MLPATIVFNPAALHISPTNVATVVLPFAPVMAITFAHSGRYCANNSTSPTTATPASIASCMAGSAKVIPGLTTNNSAAFNISASNAPQCTSTFGISALTTLALGGFSRVSATATAAPCATSQRNADRPVSPSPSTNTSLLLSDIVMSFCLSIFFI